jgi:hypothetical protein
MSASAGGSGAGSPLVAAVSTTHLNNVPVSIPLESSDGVSVGDADQMVAEVGDSIPSMPRINDTSIAVNSGSDTPNTNDAVIEIPSTASTAVLSSSTESIPSNSHSSISTEASDGITDMGDDDTLIDQLPRHTPIFTKTLHSDVDATRSLVLIQRAWTLDPLLSQVFGPADGTSAGAAQLAAVLSVLEFSAGEQIITKGEEATFAALVLDGSVSALVAPGVLVPLPAGSWVGEMALFERGPRSADIEAQGSEEQKAILAVLSYDDLERLNESGQSELAHKLTMLLAMASLKKLRKMVPASVGGSATATPSTAAPAVSSATPTDKRTSRVGAMPVHRASISIPMGHSSGAPPSLLPTHARNVISHAASTKQESLFASRLAKQAALAVAEIENRAKAELASMKNLVHRREAELNYSKENQKNKLHKMEIEASEFQSRIAELNKRLAIEKKKRLEAETLAARVQNERNETLNQAAQAEVRAREAILRVEAMEKAKITVAQQTNDQIQSMQKQLDESVLTISQQKDQLSSIPTDVVDVSSIHLAHDKDRSNWLMESKSWAEKVQTLEHEKAYHDFRWRTLQDRVEASETELAAWRRKSADYLENYEKLLIKYRHDLAELQSARSHSSRVHDTLKKLVRSLALRAYVRNWILRRRIFNIHLQVSEMVLQRWEEDESISNMDALNTHSHHNGTSPIPSANALPVGGGVADASLYIQLQSERTRNAKQMLHMQQQQLQMQIQQKSNANTMESVTSTGRPSSGAGIGGSTVSVDSQALRALVPSSSSVDTNISSDTLVPPYVIRSSPDSIFDSHALSSIQAFTSEGETQHLPRHALRMEKKRYLSALRSATDPPPSVYALLQSVTDELIELRTPLDALALSSRSLRATLDSFFQRNIQLTSRCLSTQRALEITLNNYELLKNSMKKRHQEEVNLNPFTLHVQQMMQQQIQIHNQQQQTGAGVNGGAASSSVVGGSAASFPGVHAPSPQFGSVRTSQHRTAHSVSLRSVTPGGVVDEKEDSGGSNVNVTARAQLSPSPPSQPPHAHPSISRMHTSHITGSDSNSISHPMSIGMDWASLEQKSSGYGQKHGQQSILRRIPTAANGSHTNINTHGSVSASSPLSAGSRKGSVQSHAPLSVRTHSIPSTNSISIQPQSHYALPHPPNTHIHTHKQSNIPHPTSSLHASSPHTYNQQEASHTHTHTHTPTPPLTFPRMQHSP